MVLLRCTGLLNAAEARALRQWKAITGQPVILTYRTYTDWAAPRSPDELRRLAEMYARQAADLGNGFGFYSWNEMVDTHVVPSPPEDQDKPGALTPEQSRRAVALMAAMARRYLELVSP